MKNLNIIDIERAEKYALELSFSLSRLIKKSLIKNKNNFISFDFSSISRNNFQLVNTKIYSIFLDFLSSDTSFSLDAKKELLSQQIIDFKSELQEEKKSFRPFIDMYNQEEIKIKNTFNEKLKGFEDGTWEFDDEAAYDYDALFEEEDYLHSIHINKDRSLSDIKINLKLEDFILFSEKVAKNIKNDAIYFIQQLPISKDININNEDSFYLSKENNEYARNNKRFKP